MPRILETGIREQQKHEKRKQTSVDIIVNDLHRESLKIVQKIEVLFFIQQDIYFF